MEEAVLGRREGPIWGESGQMGPLGLAYDVGVPAPVPGGRRDSRGHFFCRVGWRGVGQKRKASCCVQPRASHAKNLGQASTKISAEQK